MKLLTWPQDDIHNMKENVTKITLNERIGEDAVRIRFVVDWDSFEPGQFVMVEAPGGEVFLRRPFGIVRVAKGEAEICVKIVGKGTAALAKASVGAPLRAIGPCGKGFRLPDKGKTAVLVAGGYGIGPLFGMCEALKKSGIDAILYYGAKTKTHLLYMDELKRTGANVVVSTEDGSSGEKGMITDVLKKLISGVKDPALFSCGPHGLLTAVAKIGMDIGAATQVSMETYMACGMGVCMGCVCRDAKGDFVRVCREGPVFDAKDLKWDK